MAQQSLSHFTSIINTQLNAHTQLTEHLTHLNELLGFILRADLSDVNPSELQAQLINISEGIQKATDLNQCMCDCLAACNPAEYIR